MPKVFLVWSCKSLTFTSSYEGVLSTRSLLVIFVFCENHRHDGVVRGLVCKLTYYRVLSKYRSLSIKLFSDF